MGAKKLAVELDVEIEVAELFIEGTFQQFRKIRTYYNETSAALWSPGYVTTFTGRRRRFPNFREDRRGWTEAVNHPIQGGAADLFKLSVRNFYREVWKRRREDAASPWWRVGILLMAHDEVVARVPENLAHEAYDLLIKTMETALSLNVPLVADGQIVRNWGEAKLKPINRIQHYLEAGMPQQQIRWMFYRQEQVVDQYFAERSQVSSSLTN